MGVEIQNRCTAQLLYQRDADQAQTPANTSSRNCMSCSRACEPISAANRQTQALGIACHAPELASPCSEEEFARHKNECDRNPLGLRPRRQHSMPHHCGTVGSGFVESQASASQGRTTAVAARLVIRSQFTCVINGKYQRTAIQNWRTAQLPYQCDAD